MAGCQIERTVAGAGVALERAKREILARGGSFDGDTSGGRYLVRTPLGAIEGRYSAAGDNVRFEVDRKPVLVPCALIAKVIDEFLARAG